MTEPTPKDRATLYRKIAAVTAAVSRIPKNGENAFHHYRYATESDITDGLRELLKDNGLAFLPPSVVSWERDETADNPKQGPRTRVQVQFGIACCDTGEVFTSMLWGEGQDTSDKGFYKAYTGAVKYFLMKTFLIATGDDPERDDQPAQRPPQRQAPQRQAPTPTNGKPSARAALEARLEQTIEEARALGIDIADADQIAGESDAVLIAAGKKLRAAIEQAKQPRRMEEADLPIFPDDDPNMAELDAAVDAAVAPYQK